MLRRILIADNDPEIRDYLRIALRRPGFVIDFAENGAEVVHTLRSDKPPELIILDTIMGNGPASGRSAAFGRSPRMFLWLCFPGRIQPR
jgi:CheY-like chemotaxis protein